MNGEVVQHTTIGQMTFDIPSVIEYVSGFTTLRPGDTVEVEITGVGLLRNPVGHEA